MKYDKKIEHIEILSSIFSVWGHKRHRTEWIGLNVQYPHNKGL